MEAKTVLSIGIIFKNEIRCLDRCLSSLQPLRQALPCELVMADTGSDDGSRTVAEKYADILFDFPWINDFAAARNAVMDRCSGEWYFSLDADEWLDEDIRELVDFFKGSGKEHQDACALVERNYYTYDLKGGYGTFMPWRLLRMSTGLRFAGAIHECWDLTGKRNLVLPRTLIHHDGYVEMSGPGGKAKRERNLKLLREKMAEKPDSLLLHLQFIESGSLEPDFEEKLRRALELVREHADSWDILGASIFRYAIAFAKPRKLPEIEPWLHEAEEMFPGNYFIRMDAAFNAASYYLEAEKYDECVHWGESGLQAYEDYRAGRGELGCQLYGSLQTTTPLCEAALKVILVRGYFEKGRLDDAVGLLGGIDCSILDAQWMQNYLETLQMLHFKSGADTAPLVRRAWEEAQAPSPDEAWAEKRKGAFLRTGALRFSADTLDREERDPDFHRRVYTLYLPLKDRCILGTAAAMLDSESPEGLERLLGLVEDWDGLPISAFSHALLAGACFPPPARPMEIERLDALASRLSGNREDLYRILEQTASEDFAGSWQTLAWARALVLAAVRTCKWEDAARGMSLAKIFARVERAFLTGYYTPEVLREGNICILPVLHRFGWYCSEAFVALEAGDAAGYARLLREGLAACPGMKTMVEFLTEHTPELQTPPPDAELTALAEKVRTLMSAYPPDDPAVAALKASPAYQRVAYLIEETGA